MALYAKDQTMVLVVEDQQEQEEWYQAIKKLMEEERKDEEHGEQFDEEDDGYCTLPPAAFFKEVRPDLRFFFWSRRADIKLRKLVVLQKYSSEGLLVFEQCNLTLLSFAFTTQKVGNQLEMTF